MTLTPATPVKGENLRIQASGTLGTWRLRFFCWLPVAGDNCGRAAAHSRPLRRGHQLHGVSREYVWLVGAHRC